MYNLVSPVDIVRLAGDARELNVFDVLVLWLRSGRVVHAKILLHDSFSAIIFSLDDDVRSNFAL